MLITFFESAFKPVIPVLFRLPNRVDNFKDSVDNMLTSVNNFRTLERNVDNSALMHKLSTEDPGSYPQVIHILH